MIRRWTNATWKQRIDLLINFTLSEYYQHESFSPIFARKRVELVDSIIQCLLGVYTVSLYTREIQRSRVFTFSSKRRVWSTLHCNGVRFGSNKVQDNNDIRMIGGRSPRLPETLRFTLRYSYLCYLTLYPA